MRILLVRPPVPRHTMGLKHVMICEPLELEYVAAGLAGHEVQILDLIVERGLEARLRSFRPDVVGTSCYVTGVNEVIKLCRSVKRWNPACRTVVGGVHASRAPEDFADPAVDCIVLGDGTTVMPEVVAAFAANRSLEDIPGLALPRGAAVLRTQGRAYMPHPDTLPLPRRDLVAHLQHRYYYLFHQPVATMKTAWGCWYKCNFCFTWQITDGHAYARSPESIVAELETITADDVYIVDDIFLIKPSRLARIAQLIREKGIRKKYLVYARADFIAANEDIIAEWAGLGLSAVFIGLEAATNLELSAMDKGTTVDFNREAIAVLRRHGVDTYGSLITQPDYTPQDWERLWRFIEETGLFYVNISPLTPLPGTSIWDAYKDRLTVSRRAHGLFDLSHVLLPTRVPLKAYYRSLLRLYLRTCVDPRRARRLSLRSLPPVWSPKYLRLWFGSLRILLQMIRAHRHHDPRDLALAEDRGPPLAESAPPRPPERALGAELRT
ncbi:B12-binding domain-containing radical SAM protein [Roseomonas sp. HF4]|uniref:B12-binding domain-containing radical SAM protein n=1 Tax=Roseomonas sp. HF4 TaxID=2562313 RepID=UPI0010C053A2|nr:radical SAM protein [Roseomonas sp. HF4]